MSAHSQATCEDITHGQAIYHGRRPTRWARAHPARFHHRWGTLPSHAARPHETNLRRARALLAQIKLRIAAGTFDLLSEFPDYRYRRAVRVPLRTRTCNDVFDLFLRHEEARVTLGDLAATTLSAHRQLLDHVWRPALGALPLLGVRYSQLISVPMKFTWSKKTYNNAVSAVRLAFAFGFLDHPDHPNPAVLLKGLRLRKKDRPRIDPFAIDEAERVIAALHQDWGEAQGNYDEFRFFSGLRPSEQIALLISDVDLERGILSVTKARVAGVTHDRTKTHEDRRIALCPRALAVVKRQLALRDRLVHAGRIDHNALFVHANGRPIENLSKVYDHWRRTLTRLPIRYRKPYAARHSCVSWNLMIGGNPLFVSKQHGHSVITMLTTYAAWLESPLPTDVRAIRAAMYATTAQRGGITAPTRFDGWNDLAVNLAAATACHPLSGWNVSRRNGGADGTRRRFQSIDISVLF